MTAATVKCWRCVICQCPARWAINHRPYCPEHWNAGIRLTELSLEARAILNRDRRNGRP